jgi:AcrR family transcriptional regulator
MEQTTLAKIKEAALVLFAEKGYDNTTMKDIAKEVGIVASSIYAHYSSKRELFFHVLEQCLEDVWSYYWDGLTA